MRYTPLDSVRMLPGVGPKLLESLGSMGIVTISDLVFWKPRRYLDASNPQLLADAPLGMVHAFSVTIDNVEKEFRRGRNKQLVTALVHDDSGEMRVQWFNQPYIAQKLRPESHWIFVGKVSEFRGKRVMINPLIEQSLRVIPIYPQSQAVRTRQLHSLITEALGLVELPEVLPAAVIQKEALQGIVDALTKIHQPGTLDGMSVAERSLAFAEVWQYFLGLRRDGLAQQEPGITVAADADFLKKVVETLPFTLTNGQKRVVWDAAQEMASGKMMTRLLNGDVGSGKTVVAGLLAALVAKAGYRTALLAPTEILAEQHFQTFQRLFDRAGLRVALRTRIAAGTCAARSAGIAGD